jgi:hypothetical protein
MTNSSQYKGIATGTPVKKVRRVPPKISYYPAPN